MSSANMFRFFYFLRNDSGHFISKSALIFFLGCLRTVYHLALKSGKLHNCEVQGIVNNIFVVNLASVYFVVIAHLRNQNFVPKVIRFFRGAKN